MAQSEAEAKALAFAQGWGIVKGKFRGYTRNPMAGRAERQAKRRAYGVSRKNKEKRTRARYSRNKKRGSGSGARPRMRRDLGAGGGRVARDR
tara:strand:+ start:286 stop:561 length:276 start_codon:yes stop_codon:yes gene_type:complete